MLVQRLRAGRTSRLPPTRHCDGRHRRRHRGCHLREESLGMLGRRPPGMAELAAHLAARLAQRQLAAHPRQDRSSVHLGHPGLPRRGCPALLHWRRRGKPSLLLPPAVHAIFQPRGRLRKAHCQRRSRRPVLPPAPALGPCAGYPQRAAASSAPHGWRMPLPALRALRGAEFGQRRQPTRATPLGAARPLAPPAAAAWQRRGLPAAQMRSGAAIRRQTARRAARRHSSSSRRCRRQACWQTERTRTACCPSCSRSSRRILICVTNSLMHTGVWRH